MTQPLLRAFEHTANEAKLVGKAHQASRGDHQEVRREGLMRIAHLGIRQRRWFGIIADPSDAGLRTKNARSPRVTLIHCAVLPGEDTVDTLVEIRELDVGVTEGAREIVHRLISELVIIDVDVFAEFCVDVVHHHLVNAMGEEYIEHMSGPKRLLREAVLDEPRRERLSARRGLHFHAWRRWRPRLQTLADLADLARTDRPATIDRKLAAISVASGTSAGME